MAPDGLRKKENFQNAAPERADGPNRSPGLSSRKKTTIKSTRGSWNSKVLGRPRLTWYMDFFVFTHWPTSGAQGGACAASTSGPAVLEVCAIIHMHVLGQAPFPGNHRMKPKRNLTQMK